MSPTPASNLWPVGAIAIHAGTTAAEIERVADALGFAPILWLSGCPFFCMEQAVAMQERLEQERAAARQAEEASKN